MEQATMTTDKDAVQTAIEAQTVTDDARREALEAITPLIGSKGGAVFSRKTGHRIFEFSGEHYETIRAALSSPQQASNAETEGAPCVCCDKPSQRETPDGADMCLECFADFNAARVDEMAEEINLFQFAVKDMSAYLTRVIPFMELRSHKEDGNKIISKHAAIIEAVKGDV